MTSGARSWASVLGVVGLASACSLDFESLEHGPADARVVDASGFDGGGVDAGRRDAGPGRDAAFESSPDGGEVGEDAGARDSGGRECARPGGEPACGDPACDGASCNDGLGCTTGDRCSGGACAGSPVLCASDGCSEQRCEEPTGACRAISTMPDTTLCGAGRCCFGRCSTLRDSASCGGCNLPCDEESCTAPGEPARCVCVTNAGCPMGQTCASGRCTCTSSAQCSAGQTCVSAGTFGYCTY